MQDRPMVGPGNQKRSHKVRIWRTKTQRIYVGTDARPSFLFYCVHRGDRRDRREYVGPTVGRSGKSEALTQSPLEESCFRPMADKDTKNKCRGECLLEDLSAQLQISLKMNIAFSERCKEIEDNVVHSNQISLPPYVGFNVKHYISIVFILIASPMILMNQTVKPKMEWDNIYDGPSHGIDITLDIAMDKMNNLYLTGRSAGHDASQDLLVLRYTNIGASSIELRYSSASHSWDEGNSIAIDSKSNMFVLGSSTFDQNTFYALFHKYSANGELIWAKNFNSNLNINSTGVQVVLNSKEDPIIGYNRSFAIISKYSSAGDSLWTVIIHDDTSSYKVNYLTVDKNDKIFGIITQFIWNGGDVPSTKILFVKISDTGELIWRKQFNGANVKKIILDKEGNPILMDTDARIIKYNSQGDIMWTIQNPQIGNIIVVTDIVVDSLNDIVFTGYGLGENSWDYFTQKLSSSGAVKWIRSFNSDENINDYASSLTIDKENNIYVTGGTHNSLSIGYCYTVKYSSVGEFIWVYKYDAPHSKYERGKKIFVDDSNNVYVGGEVADSINGWNFLALNIRQENNSLVGSTDNFLPSIYSLSQNYPNPFNPSTSIKFSIPQRSHVTISIINTIGQHIATLFNETRDAGNYEVPWNANISSGLYFYRIVATGINNSNKSFVETKKMIRLK